MMSWDETALIWQC